MIRISVVEIMSKVNSSQRLWNCIYKGVNVYTRGASIINYLPVTNNTVHYSSSEDFIFSTHIVKYERTYTLNNI